MKLLPLLFNLFQFQYGTIKSLLVNHQKYLFIGLGILILAGCAAQKKHIEYREVEKEVIRKQIDTIVRFDRDSIFISEKQKGDTVYINKYVERLREKEKIKIQLDSVDRFVNVYVDKEVVKYKVPSWCWYLLIFNVLVITGVVGWGIIKAKRKILRVG